MYINKNEMYFGNKKMYLVNTKCETLYMEIWAEIFQYKIYIVSRLAIVIMPLVVERYYCEVYFGSGCIGLFLSTA